MLLLVLAALTLSASIFVASSAVTASARRRHSAVAVVRRWSAASGALRGDTSRSGDETRLVQRIGHRLISEKLADSLPQRLASAGLAGRVTAQTYVVYRLLLVAAGVFAALLIAQAGGEPAGATMLLAGAFGLVGFLIPRLLLSRRTAVRRAAISDALPDALDLLAVTVEAGLGLYGAIARLVECTSGPLADEFALVLTELRVGESSERALKRMASRLDTAEVTSFVRSLLQGEQLGLSLGQTLRNLADDSRRRRRSLAEEAAAKAPIKMLFPAALFIFPALFMVILGPAVLELGKYL